MTDNQATETPMSDHVASFWRDLRDETVQMRVDMRRVIGHDSPDGPTTYWDVAVFADSVAKALVAERGASLSREAALVEALKECLDVLDSRELQGACTIAALHGQPYSGASIDTAKYRALTKPAA